MNSEKEKATWLIMLPKTGVCKGKRVVVSVVRYWSCFSNIIRHTLKIVFFKLYYFSTTTNNSFIV